MRKNFFFFIVFEGVEGTGKSYQINKLCKSLKKKKIDVIKTREPGGSPTAEKIRNLIFSKKSDKFDKLTDFYLINAARNEHVKKTLLVAKKKTPPPHAKKGNPHSPLRAQRYAVVGGCAARDRRDHGGPAGRARRPAAPVR